MEEAAKKKGVESDIICVRREGQRVGEPGETLVKEKKPDKALRYIRDHRLTKVRKVLEESGWSEYEPIAGGICRDIRILIERVIENDLLADMVQRFRRDVQTKNKIHKLANIDDDDCKLIDHYMTKYSKYEHSQPPEPPIPVPEPDEIEKDLQKILDWLSEFKKKIDEQ